MLATETQTTDTTTSSEPPPPRQRNIQWARIVGVLTMDLFVALLVIGVVVYSALEQAERLEDTDEGLYVGKLKIVLDPRRGAEPGDVREVLDGLDGQGGPFLFLELSDWIVIRLGGREMGGIGLGGVHCCANLQGRVTAQGAIFGFPVELSPRGADISAGILQARIVGSVLRRAFAIAARDLHEHLIVYADPDVWGQVIGNLDPGERNVFADELAREIAVVAHQRGSVSSLVIMTESLGGAPARARLQQKQSPVQRAMPKQEVVGDGPPIPPAREYLITKTRLLDALRAYRDVHPDTLGSAWSAAGRATESPVIGPPSEQAEWRDVLAIAERLEPDSRAGVLFLVLAGLGLVTVTALSGYFIERRAPDTFGKIVSGPNPFWWALLGTVFFTTLWAILSQRKSSFAFDGTSSDTVSNLLVVFLTLAFAFCMARIRRPTFADEEEPPEPVSLRATLFKDTPIDDPASDRLNVSGLVAAVSRFFANPETEPPLVVGVNGPWGAGKSSFMKMVERRLVEREGFHSVWFNAWQYHKEDQILAAFLQAVATQLSDKGPWWFRARLAWVRMCEASPAQILGLVVLIGAAVGGFGFTDPQAILAADPLSLGSPTVGLLGAAGLLWQAWTRLKPFRIKFASYYAVEDHSQRIGFLEKFTQEFQLYRRALGDGARFLVCIDDLDRCPPEHLIGVFKTINLIVTSGEGAGRSFFLLGFDRERVIRVLERHLEKFSDGNHRDRDANEYLKKFVNLAVSVREPDDAAMIGMIEALPGGPDAESVAETVLPAFGKRLSRGLREAVAALLGKGKWKPLVVFAATSVALSLILHGGIGPRKADPVPIAQQTRPSGDLGGAAIEGPATRPVGGAAGSSVGGAVQQGRPDWVTAIVIPIDEDPLVVVDITPGPIELSGMLLACLLMTGLAVRGVWLPPGAPEITPEALDAQAFNDAFDFLAKMNTKVLPRNPRDLIRLANLARLFHLTQSEDRNLPGDPLTPWESVTFQVAFYVFADLLGTSSEAVVEFLAVPAEGEVGQRIQTFVAELVPHGNEHFYDRRKIDRFLVVNRSSLAGRKVEKGGAEDLAASSQSPPG